MTLAELAQQLGIPFVGDASFVIEGVASFEGAHAHALCYVQDAGYLASARQSKCGAILLSAQHVEVMAAAPCTNFLLSDHPQLSFIKAAGILHPPKKRTGIHPTAVVASSAQIASDAWIGAYSVVEEGALIGQGVQIASHCHIGERSRIGEGTQLHPRVTLLHDVHIGARCRILSGAVIGSEGFGLVHDGHGWVQVPHLGRVVIGDDVDIGANTTVDRGTLSDTLIMNGVKIDNLVQIAHNVVVGEHTAIAGCAGLAGSSVVGSNCMLAGGVGLAGHLKLADGVQVTGMSMVTKSITQAGVYSAGTPLDNNHRWRRNAARFKSLDHMARRLSRLERHLGFEDSTEE